MFIAFSSRAFDADLLDFKTDQFTIYFAYVQYI